MMAYDGKLLARARLRLEEQKSRNEAEHQRRRSEVYGKVPEIARIDAMMRGQMTQLVRLTVSRAGDLSRQIDALREKNLDLQVRRAELLVENGWTPEYLDEIVSCPQCRDTGLYQGRPCACLEKLYNAELTKELGVLLRTGDESFARFDLNLYDTTPYPPHGTTSREAMAEIFAICKKFADNFPNVSTNLLFSGTPGLGKTYLSACIARVVAEKGFSVCYDSAASALDAFERQKFLRGTEEGEAAAAKVQRMLSCDLMILDDLGTEMVTPPSVSALYTLINTRLINQKRIIISTNLGKDQLEKKYSPQIYSRIVGEFKTLTFVGRDIRRKDEK